MTREVAMNTLKQTDVLETGAESLGISLDDAQLEQFRLYYEELVDWNSRMNLTSITDWHEAQVRHFLDSLSVIKAIPSDLLQAGKYLDVGTGAGFPGIPLKMAFPGISLTLLEATVKKVGFLVHVVGDVLKLTDVEIRTGRAETLAHEAELRASFDIVFARGVASMPTLMELTLPFCRIGGIVVAQKMLDVAEELEKAQNAIETLGGTVKEVMPLTIPGLMEQRALVIVEKIGHTPEKYPRRPGMPAKRPL